MEDCRIKRPRDDEGADHDPTDLPKRRRGEGPRIDLRVLMQSKSAGAIIGKQGNNINRLRNDFKASVTVPDSNGPERVLSLGAELGTVLELLLDILPDLEDARTKRPDGECELRMIVHQSQAGCVIGKGGQQVKELREKTGAGIKVYSTCCPNSTDRVVAIHGKPKTVVGCIEAIVDLLESAPPKGHISPYDPAYSDEFLAPEYGGFITGDSKASKGLPRGVAPPPRIHRGGHRSGMNMNSNNMGRGVGRFGMNELVPNLGHGLHFGCDEVESTQVTIPKDLAGAIIGKGGARITEVRRTSCAQIVIEEALPGCTDRIITISGTHDQIQNAQYLLQKSVRQNSGNKF